MLDLSERIRDVVDMSAVPITIEELVDRRAQATAGPVTRRGPSRRTVLLAAAAAIVAVAVTGGVLLRDTTSGTNARITTPASTASRGVTPGCIADDAGAAGCERTLAEAEAIAGVDLREPSRPPSGWVLARRTVTVYPRYWQNGTNPTSVPVVGSVWTPAGTDLATSPNPPYLSIEQQPAALSQIGDCGRATSVLADGTVVCGNLPMLSNYGTNGPLVYAAALSWVEDGVWYRVRDIGLDSAELMSVLDSLR